jgi:AsmA protein
MKKALKWAGIVIAVLVVIVLALPFLINVNTFRPRIESELTTALGRNVTVGNLSLSLWSGSLAADNIAIADDPAFGSAPFVKADALNVGVNVIPLVLSKTLEIRNITLKKPQVALLRKPDGKWNFSTLGSQAGQTASPQATAPAPSAPAAGGSTAPTAPQTQSEQSLAQNFSVGELNIKDGQISIADTNKPEKAHAYRNVDLTVKNFSFTSQFPFTLTADLPGGGNVKLDGTGGPINREDTSLTPLEAKIEVKQLDLAKSGFVDAASGFSGLLNFVGTVKSDGTHATSSGDATADKLKLSPKGTPAQHAVSMKYAVAQELKTNTGQLTQGDVSVGKAVAKLSGTYDLHGESPVLKMKLNADNMPVDDLVTLLPALGVTLPSGSSLQGGTLSADLGVAGSVAQLVITGPVKLVNTKLAGFDMGSKMSAISALTGSKSGPDTSIQNFSTNVRYSPSGVQTENIDLVVPAIGTVTGNGTVSPQNALDFKMVAALSGGVGGGLTKMASMGGKGIPFFVQGTASDPKFVPDVKGMVGSQLSNQLSNRLGSQVPGGQNAQGAIKALGGMFGKKKQQ